MNDPEATLSLFAILSPIAAPFPYLSLTAEEPGEAVVELRAAGQEPQGAVLLDQLLVEEGRCEGVAAWAEQRMGEFLEAARA